MHHSELPLSDSMIKELGLGATGKHPEGRLTPDDEGEIQFAVGHDKARRKIVLDFGTPVAWVGMTPAQAVDLAKCLKWHARNVRLITPKKKDTCEGVTTGPTGES